MLLNLVGNAFDSGAKHVAIDIARDGPFATVTVRDDGRGLSPEQLAGLFDPSASVSPTGGLGLGLSIVASLARLHGGSIEASSAGPGRGATFLLRLPLAGAGAIDGGPAGAAGRGDVRI